MNTYKVLPYPDYMLGKVDHIVTYKAENIDNLRRNLAKKFKGQMPPIMRIMNENYSSIGDFSIGYKDSLRWRSSHYSDDEWVYVDPATGKTRRS